MPEITPHAVENDLMKSTEITHGMAERTLRKLAKADKARVLKLMARAAEKAYRRGFQQGAHIATTRPKDLPRDLWGWRYGTSLDVSPWADCRHREKALDRLLMECPGLRHTGLTT